VRLLELKLGALVILASAFALSCARSPSRATPVHAHTVEEIESKEPLLPKYSREREWLDHVETDLLSIVPKFGELAIRVQDARFSMTVPGIFALRGNELVEGTARHYLCAIKNSQELGIHRELKDRSGKVVLDDLWVTGVQSVAIFVHVADDNWAPLDKDRSFGTPDTPLPKVLRVGLTTRTSKQLVHKTMWIPTP